MKVILQIFEEYLKKYPAPTLISSLPGILKLNYTYSSPYTDSKHLKEVFYPISQIQLKKSLESNLKKLIYNQKGRIEESESFESISTNDKHQKLLQNDEFGKPNYSKNLKRWVYIAQIKQQTPKSYFNEGKGKNIYQHDFGELYDNVREVGIFIWDKEEKKIWRVQIDKNLIPAYPSFSNDQGTQIIFHAYQKSNFGHGIIYCFNRNVSVYKASIGKRQKVKLPNQKQIQKLEVKMLKISDQDQFTTHIFPTLSPCFNYLIYLRSKQITHTSYFDLIIKKKNEDSWETIHHIPEKFIGFHPTLKNYIIRENQQLYGIIQTVQKSCQQIYRINIKTGQIRNLTESYPNYDFSIQQVLESGLILGTVTTNNFNTFFYLQGLNLEIIDPPARENFEQKQYTTPIHGLYIEAKEEDIIEQYRNRVNKRPLLLLPHGGPHSSFMQTLTGLRYILLKLGYGLLMPNFSGSIGYGKAHLNAALGKIGEIDAQQIMDLLNIVLKDNPNIDKDNVHVQGGSYGGYMTAILGSRYHQSFKSAIILNGVLNIMANTWFTDIPEWNTVEAINSHSLSNINSEHYHQMWKRSPISQPMKIPTLQFLGAKDRRVPYRQGLLFDAITKQAGTPITTYVYQNSAHALADSVETTTDITIKTIMFLQGIKNQESQNKK